MNYKSEIYEAMHEDARADFEAGAISEARMREYDDMCFVKEPAPAYQESPFPAIKAGAPGGESRAAIDPGAKPQSAPRAQSHAAL